MTSAVDVRGEFGKRRQPQSATRDESLVYNYKILGVACIPRLWPTLSVVCPCPLCQCVCVCKGGGGGGGVVTHPKR